mmetsp:Transcript_8572/g.14879  ORF Transcript_8572/g.14879 Transcript_8572/m.14879 type:complete len:215 (-) Transcript_8572:39-683(-)
MMDVIFPSSKIKAQLQSHDNDNIGRVSSKAIDLIATCSALFVRDLIDLTNEENKDDATKTSRMSGPSTTTSRNKRTRRRTRGGETNCNGREDAPLIPKSSASTSAEAIVTLDHVKLQTKQRRGYEFLDGILDDVTERNAPKYDALARKRHKRQRIKQSSQKAAAVGSIIKNCTDNDAVDGGDGIALEEAIVEAQEKSTANDGGKEIIEDNDDYD